MKVLLDKVISDHEFKVIQEVRQYIRIRTLFNKYQGEILNCLKAFDENMNIRVLYFLMDLSLDKDRVVADQAGLLIHKLLSALSYKEIKFLENFYRNTYYGYDFEDDMRTVDLGKLSKKVLDNKYKEAIFCVLTLNGNGYVRAFAINSLVNASYGKKVPFIVLRLNDWVENVRCDAEVALNSIIANQEMFESLLESLPLFDNIGDWKRSDFFGLKVRLNTLLIDSKNRPLLWMKFLHSKDCRIKRSIFSYLMAFKDDSTLLLGLKSKDPIIIKQCISFILDSDNEVDPNILLPVLIKIKSSACKLAGIELASRSYERHLLLAYLVDLLLDRSFTVREFTRLKIKSLEPTFDFVKYYQVLLTTPLVNRSNVLTALGEVCDSSWYSFFESFCFEDDVKVRLAAVSILHGFDKYGSKDLVLDTLCSDNCYESKFMRKVLSNTKSVSTLAFELAELVKLKGFETHVYLNFVYLLQYAPKWLSIESYFVLLNADENDLNKLVLKGIQKWLAKYNRSFVKPSVEAITSIDSLFLQKAQFLPEKWKLQIRSFINYEKNQICPNR